MTNLSIAFPDKTDAQKLIISKQFYHNFIDAFLEALKMLSISEKEIQKRVTGDYEILNSYYSSGRNVQIVLGHVFNWELGQAALATKSLYPVLVVYMPLKNKIFDKIFIKQRTRFGSLLIAATNFKEEFLKYKDKRFALGLVGDQNPGVPQKAYWAPFFGKMAPFVMGPEKGAKANDAIILMGNIYKLKRGHYKYEFELLTKDANTLPEGELTRKYIKCVEDNIRLNPSNYLWSHRRWKHEFDQEKYGRNVI